MVCEGGLLHLEEDLAFLEEGQTNLEEGLVHLPWHQESLEALLKEIGGNKCHKCKG